MGHDEPGGRVEAAPRTPGWWVRAAARRWWVIVAMMALGLAAGAVVTQRQAVLYEARSTIVLSGSSGVLDPENALDLPAVAGTVARLAVSDTVLLEAANTLVAQAPPEQQEALARRTTVEWMRERVASRVPPDTSLVEITARDDPAPEAARLAEAVVAAVTVGVARLAGDDPEGGLRIAPFGPPTDGGQVSPTPARNLLVGANVGLILGLLAVALFPGRPGQLRRASQLAHVLGADVVHLPRAGRPGRLGDGVPVRATEAYEPLRASSISAAERGDSVVAVLGPVSSEAIRDAALTLAAQLAAGRERVLLVEADFHGVPWRVGDGDPLPGLAEALEGHPVELLLHRVPILDADAVSEEGSLALLAAGARPVDPASALGDPAFGDLLDRLRAQYRYVIVAGPPAEWPESTVVAEAAEMTLLVLPAGLSDDEVRQVARAREADPARLMAVGVVDHR
jgi:Mrp family chromosome partitioning ATPase/capsular polysaccharide biosynthesis protein